MVRAVFAVIAAMFFAGAPALAADTAFVGVNVIPMDEERVLEDQTVIVSAGRITALGPSAEVPLPDGAQIIDGAGRFLIPGLAEMHGHLPGAGGEAEDILFLYVARGVTTVRGMLGRDDQFALRDRINAGEIAGPFLYLAAPGISGGNTSDAADAKAKVARYKDEGWDLLKVHEGLSVAAYDAMAAEAKKHGIHFAGHVPNDVGLQRAFNQGQRTIDHLDNYLGFIGADDAPVTQEMLDGAVAATLEAEAGVVPTMALWEHFVGEPGDVTEWDELRYESPQTRAAWATRIASARTEAAQNPQAAALMIANRRKLLKALSDGGAEILLGSDAPQFYSVPGFSIHREMAVMAASGMTPYQILRSGTAAAGIYFAGADNFGTISVGARADLVLLDANPLDNIANAGAIAGVMAHGRWIDAAAIAERLKAIEDKHAE